MLWLLLSLKTATPGGSLGPVDAASREAAGSGPGQVLSCGPSISPASTDVRPDGSGRYAPVFPGWGHYHYKISTTNDSAQFYFDQGLSLYYSYHLREALASFKEAARNDSNAVMAYWGEVLAMGPYYNNTYYYKMPAAVSPVITAMNRLTANGSKEERDLIGVMNRRYDADTADGHRSQLNKAFSDGMKLLIGKYPGDVDIKAMYVNGVMIEHAWDLWDDKGVAKPWTPELVKDCADILEQNPLHPAALHYQIHLLEASLHPEAALHSADVLQGLMPGVAHMVHMSSHMYQRNGLYVKGVEVNDRANAAQHYYDSIARQLNLGSDVVHYDAVEAFCAFNAGMYVKAMVSANRCRTIMAGRPANLASRTYNQYLYMMPVFTMVRLGKWPGLLDLPVPDSGLVYARVLSDFGRGLAYLRTGKAKDAQACLDDLRGKLKDAVLTSRMLPANAPIEGARVAEGILAGEILAAAGRADEAMVVFNLAIEREDKMSYAEPKDWLLPVREFAGAMLLKFKRASEAERLYREDLVNNPGNGWALLGLEQCAAAGHEKDAAEWMDRAKVTFAQAEILPPASAY